MNLEGYRKLIAMFLPVVVGSINGLAVIPNIPLPKDYTWETLGGWTIMVIVLMIPTIVTAIAGVVYTNANVKQKVELAALGNPPPPTPSPKVNSAPAHASAQVAPVEVPAQIAEGASVKERIKTARALFGTWEGAKTYLLGTFKDRFEAALKRYAALSNSTVEAVRKTVLEVVGVQLDDKACEALGQTPGFLGAMSAAADITIISDLILAIDKTPELAYLKQAFTDRAVWYAVKSVVDSVVLRIQAGQGNAASKEALKELGLSQWQIDKSQWSGANLDLWYSTMPEDKNSYSYRQFNVWQLVGIDPYTMKDI